MDSVTTNEPMTAEVRLKAISDLKEMIGETAEGICKLREMLSGTIRMHESFKNMLNALIVEDLKAPAPAPSPSREKGEAKL